MKRILAAALALPLVAACLAAGSAEAASAPGKSCTDREVLGFITARFDVKAREFLQVPLSIYEIRSMALNRHEPKDKQYMSSVEREYCHADTLMTDGEIRRMWYLVEDWGFTGGRTIEFCIAGLDPTKVYGAHCKSLR